VIVGEGRCGPGWSGRPRGCRSTSPDTSDAGTPWQASWHRPTSRWLRDRRRSGWRAGGIGLRHTGGGVANVGTGRDPHQ
jgi:hypothetical protein